MISMIKDFDIQNLLVDQNTQNPLPITEEEVMADIYTLNINIFSAQNLKLLRTARKSLLMVYRYYFDDEIDKKAVINLQA